MCFAAPEDVVIKKMVFYQEGGSEKHLRDIAGVLATCREQFDLAYVSRSAQELGLAELWSAIQQRTSGRA